MLECRVRPGRTVQTDDKYAPGQTLTLDEDEAKSLEVRGVVEIMADGGSTPGANANRPNAKEAIKLAEAAESLAALDELAGGEERATVVAAIDKRRAELAGTE
jgi:hypothetical protein